MRMNFPPHLQFSSVWISPSSASSPTASQDQSPAQSSSLMVQLAPSIGSGDTGTVTLFLLSCPNQGGGSLGNLFLQQVSKLSRKISGVKRKPVSTQRLGHGCSLFVMAPNWKQPQCPSTGEWMDTPWYTYNGILLSDEME